MVAKKEDCINFHSVDTTFYFPNRKRLKHFLITLCRQEGYKVGIINYVFCTDDYLLDINCKYLNHDTYTDIITFGLSGKGQPLVADIYISVERVNENSKIFATGFLKELHRVIFHGALHLCGYKDKGKKNLLQMRAKEDLYLKQYFVSRETKPYKS